MLRDIFNISLSQVMVPSGFKAPIMIPVPKKTVMCLNKHHLVDLRSAVVKCFE